MPTLARGETTTSRSMLLIFAKARTAASLWCSRSSIFSDGKSGQR
jgi:hypothetical protein